MSHNNCSLPDQWPFPVFILDHMYNRIEHMNQQFIALFGYSHEDIPDIEHWWELAYPVPAEREEIKALWNFTISQTASSNQSSLPIETGVICKDKSRKSVEMRIHPFGNQLVVYFLDQSLRHLETTSLNKLGRAVDQSPVSIIITDVTGNIEYVNPAFTAITGFTANEVYGCNPSILKSDKMPLDIYKELWDTILNGNVWHGELIDRKKSGEYYNVASSIAPVINEHGIVTNFIGISMDITNRKNLENQIKSQNQYQSAIAHLGQEALAGLTVQKLTEKIETIIQETLSADKVEFYLYDRESNTLIQTHPPTEDPIQIILDGTTSEALAYQEKKRITLTSKEGKQVHKTSSRNFKSLHLPIGTLINSYGVLSIHMKKPRIFFESDLVFLQSISNILAATIERNLAEEDLRESEDRYHRLSESTLEGIFFSISGIVYDANNQALKMLGYKPEEITGKNLLDFIDPSCKDDVKDLLKNNKEAHYETRMVRSDGIVFHVEIQARVIPYRDKKFRVTVFHDISEQKKTLAALQENEYWLNRSQAVSRTGSFVIDYQKGFWTSSETLNTIFGIDSDFDKTYQNWFELIHPGDQKSIQSYLETIVQEKKHFDKEYRIINRRSQQALWVHGLGELLFDKDGSLLRMFGTIQDISDKKENQIKLLNYQKTLENLNQNLQSKIKEELQKNRDKDIIMIQQSRLAAMGEMVHNIAHQWRQPLNALGLLIQNIQIHYNRASLTEDIVKEKTEKAMQMIMFMSRTIDDFKDFFKPDKEMQVFTLIEAIQKVRGMVDDSYRHNNIMLILEILEDCRIIGYSNEYAQVLMNILTNAKDTILDRHPQNPLVKIRVFQERGPSGLNAVVTISDNAGGIPPDIITKIFDPYFTTKASGSGVGLYMSKMIIERNMHGQISVRNTSDGAEFKISLPLTSSS